MPLALANEPPLTELLPVCTRLATASSTRPLTRMSLSTTSSAPPRMSASVSSAMVRPIEVSRAGSVICTSLTTTVAVSVLSAGAGTSWALSAPIASIAVRPAAAAAALERFGRMVMLLSPCVPRAPPLLRRRLPAGVPAGSPNARKTTYRKPWLPVRRGERLWAYGQVGLDGNALLDQRGEAAVLRSHHDAGRRLPNTGHVAGHIERACVVGH